MAEKKKLWNILLQTDRCIRQEHFREIRLLWLLGTQLSNCLILIRNGTHNSKNRPKYSKQAFVITFRQSVFLLCLTVSVLCLPNFSPIKLRYIPLQTCLHVILRRICTFLERHYKKESITLLHNTKQHSSEWLIQKKI